MFPRPFPMRSSIHFLLALLFLATGLPTLRAGPWEDANAAFAAGDYVKAQRLYQGLIDREGPTAARLFNLGNAYAKLNRPGLAVLCYERAALLSPRDGDIRANLKLTRPANATTLQSPAPWWTAPLFWLSLNEWSWLTAWGLVLLTAPLLTRTFLTSRPNWLQSTTAPLIGAGLALALPGALALQQRGHEKDFAIITAGEPVLRLSPFPNADPVDFSFPLPGQRVIPGERHGAWVHLNVPGSTNSGWVPHKDIALIIPAS